MLSDLYMDFLLFDFSYKWFLATFLLCCFVAFIIATTITFLRVVCMFIRCLYNYFWGSKYE